jgi:hypothetical protein
MKLLLKKFFFFFLTAISFSLPVSLLFPSIVYSYQSFIILNTSIS